MSLQTRSNSVNLSAQKAGVSPTAIQFNASSYAQYVGIIPGSVDSKTFFISTYFDVGPLADGATGNIIYENGGRIQVARWPTNVIRVITKDNVFGIALRFDSVLTYTSTVNTGWHHLCAWGNTTLGNQVSELYIDGVSAISGAVNNVDVLMDVNGTDWGYAASDNGSDRWAGKIAHLYADSREDRLASVMSSNAVDIPPRFRNSDGSVRTYPNELVNAYGTKGERPLGFQPRFYLAGSAANFNSNSGSAGDLSIIVAGATDTAPPP